MNFYIDFEATQFSHRVISIGCITSDGDSFYTLVKPINNEKITQFITDLTGITNEMLAEAPTAEDSFIALRSWIREHAPANEETFFFSYGNNDSHFLDHTARCLENFELKDWIYYLSGSLIDYSTIVDKYFKANGISLKKALAYFRGTPIIQKHDALEDADMLREVALAIAHAEPLTHSPFAKEIAERAEKQRINNERNAQQQDVKDGAILVFKYDNGEIPYQQFSSLTAAAKYVFNTLLDINQQKTVQLPKIKKNIKHAIRTNKPYFKYYWKKVE